MSAEEHEKTLSGISNFGDAKGLSRDRPWLLPSNRKLRHLEGISLRNLNLSQPPVNSSGRAIDDESLQHTLKTPAKAIAQRESRKLEHSRSSSDLKSPLKVYEDSRKGSDDNNAPETHPPSTGKLRRRSTLNWTNAPPRVRQSRLEDAIREKMPDTWFSLHCRNVSEPIYVSEAVEGSLNPSFRFFDLNVYGPSVTRLDTLTIKFWARARKMSVYTLLVELQLCLRSLQYIGKSLESFFHPLPSNCILLHLSDGIYTSFTDLPLDEPVLATPKSTKQVQGLQHTSSFDALMRLSNLDDCIQDALATREKISSQINDLLQEQKRSSDVVNASSQAEQSLASTKRAFTASQKLRNTTQLRRSKLQASLEARRAAIASGGLAQQKAEVHLASASANLSSRASLLQSTKAILSGQLRRICEDLLNIYPIEPIESKPLAFSIRGLHLPNAASSSGYQSTDPAVNAAALGIVAHITHLLSFYLSVPIPYPPAPHGSTSTIFDPISINMQSSAARTFPLYQKGAVTYRFEYGVFMLNTDIELLMSRQGLRMVDQRNTLPNLKYLLTVLTAGKGELPSRKKGRVRGEGNGGPVEEKRKDEQRREREQGLLTNGNHSI